jgi:hypothetical protein
MLKRLIKDETKVKEPKKSKLNEPMNLSNFLEVEFKLPMNFLQNRILFAGLFPPAKSKTDYQHANTTSSYVMNTLGHNYFDWIDIFCLAPSNLASDVDETKLKKFLQENEEYRIKWKERLLQRVSELNQKSFIPVVFICGVICNEQWEQLLFDHAEKIENNGFFPIFRIQHLFDQQQLTFTVLCGQHPSASLQAHGNPITVETFQKEMLVLNLLRDNQDIADVISKFGPQVKLHAERLSTFLQDRFQTTTLPSFLNHMKRLPFYSDLFFERLQHIHSEDHLKSVSFMNRILLEDFWTLYIHGFQYSNRQILEALFSYDAFCVHILDSGFLNRFDMLRNHFQDMEIIVKLYKSSGFCVRIMEPIFWQRFQALGELLTQEHMLKLYNTEAFCTHIQDETFLDIFNTYYNNAQFGKEYTIRLFTTESFCQRVLNTEFLELFNMCYKSEQLGKEYTIRLFTTESFCQRALNTEFLELFNTCYNSEQLGKENTARLFTTESFCVRVLQVEFRTIFRDFCEFLGTDYTLKLFRTESFCTRVLENDFRHILAELYNFFKKEYTMKLFSTESFCVRVLDINFRQILYEFYTFLQPEYAIKLFCTESFCVRILDANFRAILKECYNFLEPEYAIKLFCTDSFCVRILDANFRAILKECYNSFEPDYTIKLFCTESFSSHILDNNFRKIFIECYQFFGSEDALKLFSTESFCSHILDLGFMDYMKSKIEPWKMESVIILFKTEGFANHVLNSRFQELLQQYIETYDLTTMISVFSNPGFCANLLKPEFQDQIKLLSKVKIPMEFILKFLEGPGFCRHLVKEFFVPRFKLLAENYSINVVFPIFRNDSFCKYISTSKFLDSILQLHSIFSNKSSADLLNLDEHVLDLLKRQKICSILYKTPLDFLRRIRICLERVGPKLTVKLCFKNILCDKLDNKHLLHYVELWHKEHKTEYLEFLFRSEAFGENLVKEGSLFISSVTHIMEKCKSIPIIPFKHPLQNESLLNQLSLQFVNDIISVLLPLGFGIDDIYVLMGGKKFIELVKDESFLNSLCILLLHLNDFPFEKHANSVLASLLTSDHFCGLCQNDVIGFCTMMWMYLETLFTDWSNITKSFVTLLSCDSFYVAYKACGDQYLTTLASLFLHQEDKDLYLLSLFSNYAFLVRCKDPEFVGFFQTSFAAFGANCIPCFADGPCTRYILPTEFCKNTLYDQEFAKWESFRDASEWKNYLLEVPNKAKEWWDRLYD